ncbi:hypothetical protein PROCOU_17234 [Listeria rocourtiae FSL F6-920]|nr:hypothetical protein PROCOU_17234 [Listeria rocourtiae FSL F6-920]
MVQAKMTFITLPVKNLNTSVDFFAALGFEFNPQFTDENATCLILNDTTFVMLVVESFFKNFTKKRPFRRNSNNRIYFRLLR